MTDRKVPGSAGGQARAAALSDERKEEIARKAAAARWGEKPLRATHRGSFKQEFGIDVDCYVLDDPGKTAVISQTGMGRALGMSSRAHVFPRFISSQMMSTSVGTELRQKIQNPVKFQWGTGGTDAPPSTVHGFNADLLIEVCQAIMKAESDGRLKEARYRDVIRQAHVIVGASAKSGIRGLVYALAGYNPTADEVITAFKLYVREEAREYEREFPEQLYVEWYRLYNLPKPEKNRPWKFKHLTLEHVYQPLAKSNGKVLQLAQAARVSGRERWKKLHQFLSDIGVKALRTQLGQTLGIAQVSETAEQYEANIKRVFGGQGDLFRGR